MDNADIYFKEATKIINNNKKYLFRIDKKEELKEGKKDSYLSDNLIHCSRAWLNEVFNNRRSINVKTILKILEPIIGESIKLSNIKNEKGIDYLINYFFEEI